MGILDKENDCYVKTFDDQLKMVNPSTSSSSDLEVYKAQYALDNDPTTYLDTKPGQNEFWKASFEIGTHNVTRVKI